MRVLDLFSGIGGFSLGLERAGMTTVAFCEINPYCRAVLTKRWPKVPIYDDIRTLTAARLAADGIAIDVICGGFPCQDISIAGNGTGLKGERSGLWNEYRRLIEEIRPKFVIIENVALLRSRGLETILGQLHALGYDAEWHCISASAVGAPHIRDRLWIIAYPELADTDSVRYGNQRTSGEDCRTPGAREGEEQQREWFRPELGRGGASVAHPNRQREPQQGGGIEKIRERACDGGAPLAYADGEGLPFSGPIATRKNWRIARRESAAAGWWGTEPDVGRVAHGVPSRVDRIRALGNAVVPQIPEAIGRMIMSCSKVGDAPLTAGRLSPMMLEAAG